MFNSPYKTNAEFRSNWPEFEDWQMKRVAKQTVKFYDEHNPAYYCIVYYRTKIIHDSNGFVELQLWDSNATRNRFAMFAPGATVSTHNNQQYVTTKAGTFLSAANGIFDYDSATGEPMSGAIPARRRPWEKMHADEKALRRVIFKARDRRRGRPSWRNAQKDLPFVLTDKGLKSLSTAPHRAMVEAIRFAAELFPENVYASRYDIMYNMGYYHDGI